MAEKFLEEILGGGLKHDDDVNKSLQNRFADPSAYCSIEEFAGFYFNLIKTQTDEFIKSNISTCNTPRKSIGNIAEDTPDSSKQDLLCYLKTLQNRAQQDQKAQEGSSVQRQSSRELFVNQNDSAPLQKTIDSPMFATRKSLESSTPVNKFNRSIDFPPVNTSTPQSFRNTNNSFSINDQSSLTFRNSPRNSLDTSSRNNSINKRNTSSPFCLGDFFNTSAASNSGKGKRNNASQSAKFYNDDFPSLGGEVPPKKIETKPKKRVVPITVSRKTGSSSFASSSFQGENNLLNGEMVEGVDILSERRKMRSISKDFSIELEPQKNLHENLPIIAQSPLKTPTFRYDKKKVERRDVLITMAQLYSFLIDMNLVPNILSEFSYLVGLLNTDHDPKLIVQDGKSLIDIVSNLLKNLNNCIFFAIQVLNSQKQNLALLDVMTIRVVIDNERIQQLPGELYEHLCQAVQQKSKLEQGKLNKSHNNTSQVVFFQQETDNRDNFPSDREFLSFKTQRDMFYKILRSWELKHLDPSYDFRKDLGMKIRSLIAQMEHPINMAHLAKLFTAQLIISCNFDNSANELQMALPGIDLSKLSKLRQRLVAPSQFSTQYLFPGNQAFFRDFILCAESIMFMEQLKISLINDLMEINDSSIETLSITPGNDEEEKSFCEEFIVRAETMTTMRVLAKFIGFVVSRPYTFDGCRNTLVDQKQTQIRNLLQPDFDVHRVVLRAIDDRKLLVTIPWLVEYLAMLDFITIRLDYYRELFQLLYTIYMRVNGSLCVMPTSKFIVKICLGWLFEHPEIPEDYYSFNSKKVEMKVGESELPSVTQLNPHLETILTAACPFLADFRVSMMPQRTTKALSRTGRYRHITTKIQEKPATPSKVQDNRERLIEAFLVTQTASVRKIVDFTIDRVSSAVVKDFQVKHLLAIKKEAKAETEKLEAIEVESLMKKMIEVFKRQLNKLTSQWTVEVEVNCKSRVIGAFDSLLPIETLGEVKKTLVNITIEKTNEKLHEWRIANLNTIEVFSKDIQAEAMKLIENEQLNGNKRTTSSITIDLSAKVMPSDYFKMFQSLLHKASLHPENLECGDVTSCLEMAMEVLDKQVLPLNAYRNIAFYTLQFLLQLIVNRPDFVSNELRSEAFRIFRHEKLLPFTSPEAQEENNQQRAKVENYIFSNVVSGRFLLVMQGKPRKNLALYGDFLVDLVREKFITLEHITEQCVKLYQHEWSPQSLDDISFLARYIKNSLAASNSSESHLFMELVADFASDMENF